MNFLELCQATRREAGAAGQGPDAVTGQTGENLRIVNWVQEAWRRIQRSRDGWRWMRAETGAFSLTPNVAVYAASAIVPSRFSRWHKDSFILINGSSRSFLSYVPWDDFRAEFLYVPSDAGLPQFVSIAPDDSLYLHPKPNAAYVLRGSYQKSVQELTANTSVPEMPVDFHMAIVYGALMLYARYEAAQEIMAEARASYNSEMQRLERSQLEELTLAHAPLVA